MAEDGVLQGMMAGMFHESEGAPQLAAYSSDGFWSLPHSAFPHHSEADLWCRALSLDREASHVFADSLLVALIVLAIIFAIVRAIIPMLGLPAPWPTVINLVLLLIALLVIVGYLGGFGGLGYHSGCYRLSC